VQAIETPASAASNPTVEAVPEKIAIAGEIFDTNQLTGVFCVGVIVIWLLFQMVRLLSQEGIVSKIVEFFSGFFATCIVIFGLLGLYFNWNFPLSIPFLEPNPLTWVWLIYILNSCLAFILYGYDKLVATLGKWRIPEAMLHYVELLGGWPGALFAQPVFNHKTNWNSKFDFKVVTWLISLLHIGYWIWRYFAP
jgi:uncharacterized membrane protein YsdA (DUF1294 family)